MIVPGLNEDAPLTPEQVRQIAGSIAESLLEQMDGRALAAAALARSIEAGTEPDALRQQNKMREGQILAALSLTDSIQELMAMFKEIAGRQIDSTQDLDRTIQKATNATVAELRRVTVREAA